MVKIGVMVKNYDEITGSEFRIIQKIIDDPDLQLSLLIIDLTKNKDVNCASLWHGSNLSFSTLGSILLELQSRVEKRIYPERTLTNNTELTRLLLSVPTVQVNPCSDGDYDTFTTEETEHIRSYELDVILKQGFKKLKGDVMNVSKFGVWSLLYGENIISESTPIGLWEIILKEPTVKVLLTQHTDKSHYYNLIETAHFNKTYSARETHNEVVNSSISLLFKNINKLKNGQFEPKSSEEKNVEKIGTPSLKNSIAIARVPASVSDDDSVQVDLRGKGKFVDVRVLKLPFVRNGKQQFDS